MIARRSDIAIVAGAGLFAVLLPVWLLWPRALPPSGVDKPALVQPRPVPDPDAIGQRQLFAGGGDVGGASLPSDAPELIGIVGRPPHDAIALVRTPEGRSKSIAPGESYAGWRLEAVSAEAALFSRGALQIRVPMPAAEPSDLPEGQ